MDAINGNGNGSDYASGYGEDIVILGDSKYCELTKWRFPDGIDTCPTSNCKKRFESRAILVQHYRRVHAKYFMLCSDCDIPVPLKYFNEHEKTNKHRIARSTKKVEEYRNNEMHKKSDATMNRFVTSNNNQKQPTERDNINKNDIATDHDNKNADDTFHFTVFDSDKVKEWQYPNSEYCIIPTCQKRFATRELAVGHYRGNHAKFVVWCKICNRGIMTKSHDRFHKHYQTAHPDEEWPAYYQKYLPKFNCVECNECFSGERDQTVHMMEEHGDDQMKTNRQTDAMVDKPAEAPPQHDRQSDRQSDRQYDRQNDRQNDRQSDHQIDHQNDHQYDRQHDRSNNRQNDRSSDRHNNRSNDRQNDHHIQHDQSAQPSHSSAHPAHSSSQVLLQQIPPPMSPPSPQTSITTMQNNEKMAADLSRHEPKSMMTFEMPKFELPKNDPMVNIKPEPKDDDYDAVERMHSDLFDPRPTISNPMYAHKAFIESIQEFECVNCNRIFDDEGALHHHMSKKHQMNATQSCVICKHFLRCNNAREHYFVKHSCFVNQCPFCMLCFMDLDSFQGHIIAKHSGDILYGNNKTTVKMERMSDDEQMNDSSNDGGWGRQRGNDQYWRKKANKRPYNDSEMRPDPMHRPWKYPKKDNASQYSGMPKHGKRGIPPSYPNRGYEMMDNRYRNKYGSNGMYPLTKIKAEMISDNEADNMFENSSNEMSQSEFN